MRPVVALMIVASASQEHGATRSRVGAVVQAPTLTPRDERWQRPQNGDIAAVISGLVTKQVCAAIAGVRLYESVSESYISNTGQARGQASLRNPDASDRVERGL